MTKDNSGSTALTSCAAGREGRAPTMDCPRNFTRDELIAGLKAGRSLMLDRRDAPELADLLELEREGLVESKLVEFDEQSSALRFRWCDKQ
jgi:hypothetical protein